MHSEANKRCTPRVCSHTASSLCVRSESTLLHFFKDCHRFKHHLSFNCNASVEAPTLNSTHLRYTQHASIFLHTSIFYHVSTIILDVHVNTLKSYFLRGQMVLPHDDNGQTAYKNQVQWPFPSISMTTHIIKS
jgi:hypothetical protein